MADTSFSLLINVQNNFWNIYMYKEIVRLEKLQETLHCIFLKISWFSSCLSGFSKARLHSIPNVQGKNMQKVIQI